MEKYRIGNWGRDEWYCYKTITGVSFNYLNKDNKK